MSNIQDYNRPVLEGHFHIECLDKNNNVIDQFDDHNMIMTSARQTMSEIFAKLDTATYATRFVIGNLGCKGENLFVAKTSSEGFAKERTSLFSEFSDTLYYNGAIIASIHKGDIIKYNFDNGLTGNYTLFEYSAESTLNYVVTDENIKTDFKELVRQPYTYSINFALPGHSMSSSENCIVNPDECSDQVYMQTKDTSVVFTFILDTDSANNGQYNVDDFDTATSIFNEAAIYVNGRIFCMKTFPSKVKDMTVKMKITWTITF